MAETNTKKIRQRSPAYPYLDLQESVDRLEMFYKAESLHHTPVNIAAKDIGYKDGSNRGWRAIASLTSFGFLDEEGSKENRQVFLSETGKEIVHFGSKDSEDAMKAIREAALKPAIYADLWAAWLKDGQSLPSEEAMKRYLIKDKAFNPESVDGFIKGFKNTLNYAGLIKDGKITSSNSSSGSRDQNSTPPRQRNNTGVHMTNNTLQDNTIPLIGGSTAILTIPRPLSKKNYDLIKNWLVLMEPSLTEENNTATKKDEDETKE